MDKEFQRTNYLFYVPADDSVPFTKRTEWN